MISFHDVMKAYRWDVRFLSFVFGIAEANAFSCYKIWGNNSDSIVHSDFKCRLAQSLLERSREFESYDEATCMTTRSQSSSNTHKYATLAQYPDRKRLVCRTCKQLELKPAPRVSKRCVCNADPMCEKCHQQHFLKEMSKNIPM